MIIFKNILTVRESKMIAKNKPFSPLSGAGKLHSDNIQRSTPHRRALQLFVLVTVLMTTLSGCSLWPEQGQSLASAQKAVQTIRGVETAKITLYGGYSGFQKEWRETVKVKLKPGFQPKDTTAFVNYIASTAWSINEHKLTIGIVIIINTTPQINLDAVGKKAGWTYLVTFADQPSGVISDSVSLTKQLGAWPGNPPKKSDKTTLVQIPASQSKP